MKRCDYRPIIDSFLKRVQKAGFILRAADYMGTVFRIPNGAIDNDARRAVTEFINRHGVAFVSVQHREDGRRRAMCFTLGGTPIGILWDISKDPAFDEIIEAHIDYWEGRNVPMVAA